MNKHFLTTLIRDNWYLLAALVVCVGAFAYKVSTSSDEPAPVAGPTVATVSRATSDDNLDKLLRSPNGRAREDALNTIRAHQAKIDADPKSEEVPALLSAMGNLYSQKLGDHAQAAACYETNIRDHADWGEIRTSYIQLASCYERLNDQENARRVYRLMMEKFPEESQEYKYASAMTFQGSIPPRAQ